MIRNMATLEFTMFEDEAGRYVPSNYRWERNRKGNLEGYNAQNSEHRFTWQPHGSQFTVFHHVPNSAYRFRINHTPGVIEPQHILNLIHFRESWIEPVTMPLRPAVSDE